MVIRVEVLREAMLVGIDRRGAELAKVDDDSRIGCT